MDLTKRQQEIVDFIKRYSARHGYPPTVRDIGKAVGLASSSTVHQHLANLERVGLLRRDPSKPRALELLDRAVQEVRSIVRPAPLPLLGAVAAGQPMLAEENIEEYVAVPAAAGGDDGAYLLRVRGESMKNVGDHRGRPRRRAPAGHALRTATSSSRSSARRRRSSASSARPTTCGCSPRTTRWSRSEAARCACSAASSA